MLMVPCGQGLSSILSILWCSHGYSPSYILIIYCYTLIVLVYGSIQWLEVMVILLGVRVVYKIVVVEVDLLLVVKSTSGLTVGYLMELSTGYVSRMGVYGNIEERRTYT